MDREPARAERRVEAARVGAVAVGEERHAAGREMPLEDGGELGEALAVVRDLRREHDVEAPGRIERG